MKKYEINPQHDWCVFEEVKAEEARKGLIVLPQSKELPMKMGRVIFMGPNVGEETKAKSGDLVLYHEKVGVPFMINGDKLLVTKGENFYCILKEIKEETEDEVCKD